MRNKINDSEKYVQDIFYAVKNQNIDLVKNLIERDQEVLNATIAISSEASGSGNNDRDRKYSIPVQKEIAEDYAINHNPAFYTLLQIYAEKYKNTTLSPYGMARIDMNKEYLEDVHQIKAAYREILKTTIKNIDSSIINDTYSNTGRTLLHYLANDNEFRNILLENGADAKIKDRYGLTAFDQIKSPRFHSKLGSSMIGLGVWILNQDSKFCIDSIIENAAILIPVTLGPAIAKAIDVYMKARSLKYSRSDSLYESLKVTGVEALKYSSAIVSGSAGAIIIGAITVNPIIASISIIASSVTGSYLVCNKALPFMQKIINEKQNSQIEDSIAIQI